MLSSVLKVWILGASHPNADRSISWDEPIQNFGEPDVLIVNLGSLTEKVLARIDKDDLQQARSFILDKFINKGIIIVITQPYFSVSEHYIYSNYYLFPIQSYTEDVPEGSTILFNDAYDFKPYVQPINKFTFYLKEFNSGQADWHLKNNLRLNAQCFALDKQDVTDNAGHILGRAFSIFEIPEGPGELKHLSNAGELVFLPPSTESVDEALTKILYRYGKIESKAEPEPEWLSKISLPQIKQKISQIEKLESQKNALQTQIDIIQKEKTEILNHHRLLFSKNTQLEDAVCEAFKLMGFNEIRKIREADREDWVFDFKYEKQFKYGVIEVKGADNRTKQEHIVQTNKWIDERFAIDEKVSKGIFIPNQHRKKEYSKSKRDRAHFEPNELDYAKMKSICIIPCFVLFEAVKDVLEGKKKHRKDIEKLIATSNSVLIKL